MNLTVIKGGPDQRVWERVPIVARREDVERSVALYREALALLREADALELGGTMGSLAEDELSTAEGSLAYYERCLAQPGEFIVVALAVEEDDWESPDRLERQRQRNAAIGAGNFVPPAGLDVLGAED